MNEPTWINDGFNELIVDFLFALVLFLDSTQPRPLKYPKKINFLGSNKRMSYKYNSNTKPNLRQQHSSFPSAGSFKCTAGVPLMLFCLNYEFVVIHAPSDKMGKEKHCSGKILDILQACPPTCEAISSPSGTCGCHPSGYKARR